MMNPKHMGFSWGLGRNFQMKRELSFVARALALVSVVAGAAPMSFDITGHNVKMDLPNGWRASTNMVKEIPLSVAGPAVGNEHPIVSVMFATDKADTVTFNGGKEDAAYKEGRQEWLSKQQDGQALEFFPFAKVEGAKTELSSVGYRFKVASNEYIERAYYARCGSNLFYMQTQMTPATAKASGANMEKLVKSFRCQ